MVRKGKRGKDAIGQIRATLRRRQRSITERETLIVKTALAVVEVMVYVCPPRYCIAIVSGATAGAAPRGYYCYGLPNARTRHRPLLLLLLLRARALANVPPSSQTPARNMQETQNRASAAESAACGPPFIRQASCSRTGREQMTVPYIRRACSIARRTRDHACARPITRSRCRVSK
jgi:hypothetical protein